MKYTKNNKQFNDIQSARSEYCSSRVCGSDGNCDLFPIVNISGSNCAAWCEQHKASAGAIMGYEVSGEDTQSLPYKIELIKYPTEEDWMFVKQCTLVTVGKDSLTPPSEKLKRTLLKARHSPIRELRFAFRLTGVPYYVSVHLARHIHAQPYVRSQRNDRQDDYDRNAARQDAPVDMIWTMGGEELLIIVNKRSCSKADAATRAIVGAMCRLVRIYCPEFSEFLVPMCEYHGGVCYEPEPCGKLNEK